MRKELFFGIGRRARPAALFLASTLPGVALAQRQQGPPGSRGEQSAQEATPQAEVELETGITLTRSGRFAEAIPHFLAARGHVSSEYAAEFNLALCYVGTRSEEHTSELQSRVDLVCRLLLEKKK